MVPNLTFSWRRSLSYRNQSIDLQSKSMDWFLYDRDLRHEKVNKGHKHDVMWFPWNHLTVSLNSFSEAWKQSPGVFCKKTGALTNFAILTGKYLCWSLYLKRHSNTGVFLWILWTFLRLYILGPWWQLTICYFRQILLYRNVWWKRKKKIWKCLIKLN